jgi:hypothetical protein
MAGAPKYIWHLVARFLPLNSILALTCASKQLQEFFNDEKFWKNKCLRDFSADPSFIFMLDEPSKTQYVDFVRYGFDESISTPYVCRITFFYQNGLDFIALLEGFDYVEDKHSRYGDNHYFVNNHYGARRPDVTLRGKKKCGIRKKTFELNFLSCNQEFKEAEQKLTDGVVFFGDESFLKKKVPTILGNIPEAYSPVVFTCGPVKSETACNVPYRLKEDLWKRYCEKERLLKMLDENCLPQFRIISNSTTIPFLQFTGDNHVKILRGILEEFAFKFGCAQSIGSMLGDIGRLKREKNVTSSQWAEMTGQAPETKREDDEEEEESKCIIS